MALRDNLVSWWPLDEASGTRADAHGSYDLTDNNTVPTITGHINANSADFTPGNTEYLDSATTFGAAVGSSVTTFSAQAWFKRNLTGGNDGMVYIGSFAGAHGEFQWQFGGGDQTNTAFDAGVQQSGYTFTDTASWHHIVVSYNGTDYTIWLDNVKKITAVAYTTALNFTGLKMVIGGYYSSTYLWDGGIENVAVWNRALSDAEVSELWNSGSGYSYADTDAAAGGGAVLPVPTLSLLGVG